MWIKRGASIWHLQQYYGQCSPFLSQSQKLVFSVLNQFWLKTGLKLKFNCNVSSVLRSGGILSTGIWCCFVGTEHHGHTDFKRCHAESGHSACYSGKLLMITIMTSVNQEGCVMSRVFLSRLSLYNFFAVS